MNKLMLAIFSILLILIAVVVQYYFTLESDLEICESRGGTYTIEEKCSMMTKKGCLEFGATWNKSRDLCFDGELLLLEVHYF